MILTSRSLNTCLLFDPLHPRAHLIRALPMPGRVLLSFGRFIVHQNFAFASFKHLERSTQEIKEERERETESGVGEGFKGTRFAVTLLSPGEESKLIWGEITERHRFKPWRLQIEQSRAVSARSLSLFSVFLPVCLSPCAREWLCRTVLSLFSLSRCLAPPLSGLEHLKPPHTNPCPAHRPPHTNPCSAHRPPHIRLPDCGPSRALVLYLGHLAPV